MVLLHESCIQSVIHSLCLNLFKSGFASFDHCFWSDQFDKINDRISLENTNNDGACITGVIVDGKQMLFGKNGKLQSFWIDGDQNNCYDNFLGTNQITIKNGLGMFQNCCMISIFLAGQFRSSKGFVSITAKLLA